MAGLYSGGDPGTEDVKINKVCLVPPTLGVALADQGEWYIVANIFPRHLSHDSSRRSWRKLEAVCPIDAVVSHQDLFLHQLKKWPGATPWSAALVT